MPERFLIVGLGNPGREYRRNRHNAGFMLLDRFVEQHRLMGFTKRQGKALITTGVLGESAFILAKPQTYMNLSGGAVSSLARFYQLPLERLLVCGDDIDLPLGVIRLRAEGGSAGQRGMESVIEHLSTKQFPRLRLGVGRPPGRMEAADYVLRDFPDSDLELLSMTLDRAVEAIELFIQQGLAVAMNRYNNPREAGADQP